MHLALPGPVNLTKVLIRDCTDEKEGDVDMNRAYREPGAGIVLIIVLVLLYVLLNPVPGPVDDAAVAAAGGYYGLKRL